jgi:hypothetical protein
VLRSPIQKAQSAVASLLVRAVLFCMAAVPFYRYFIINRPLILVQFASFLSSTTFCTRIRLFDYFHHAFSFRVALTPPAGTHARRRARGSRGHVCRCAKPMVDLRGCLQHGGACLCVELQRSGPASGTAACRPGTGRNDQRARTREVVPDCSQKA